MTKVVGAAAVMGDEAALDAIIPVADSSLLGMLMTWPTYKPVATAVGFAASRDSTGIPALSAMANKVSPSWTLVVFVAKAP